MDDSGNGFIPGVQGCFSCEKTQKNSFPPVFCSSGFVSGRIEQKPPGGDGEKDVKCGKLAD